MINLEKLNHFQKFNFETKFKINSDELEARYLKLQQQFHPDISKDQAEAEINSILINQAYQTLKNPIKRAIYLLQLQGIDIDSEDSKIKPSGDILMFIMELREEILENKNDQTKIDEVKKRIKKLIVDEMQDLQNLLIRDEYQEASQILIKVKYLDKIIFDLKRS